MHEMIFFAAFSSTANKNNENKSSIYFWQKYQIGRMHMVHTITQYSCFKLLEMKTTSDRALPSTILVLDFWKEKF